MKMNALALAWEFTVIGVDNSDEKEDLNKKLLLGHVVAKVHVECESSLIPI